MANNINHTADITSKRWGIVLLLFVSCVIAIYLLLNTDPVPKKHLTTSSQLDSLITLTFNNLYISDNQVRMRTVEIDSLFYRNIYTVSVPPEFSKTTFHYSLHEQLWAYNVETLARVEFPDRNMRIHLIVNDKVRRSVYLNSR